MRLAAHLGWLFVDTGVFYRVLTHQALKEGVSPSNEPALVELARGLQIRLVGQPADGGSGLAVWVNGAEVTAALRTPAVEAEVSAVAALPHVRAALIEPQRSAVGEHAAVVAGRDIGTVIFPDAGLKIYLDASPTERAEQPPPASPGSIQSRSSESRTTTLRRSSPAPPRSLSRPRVEPTRFTGRCSSFSATTNLMRETSSAMRVRWCVVTSSGAPWAAL